MQPERRKLMKRYEPDDGPRFITFSCYQRLPLLGHAAIRDLFAGQLVGTRAKHGIRIIAWVVMPEHVHLLLRPRVGEVSLVPPLWALKRDFARAVIARWRALNAPILDKLRVGSGVTVFWERGGGHDRYLGRGSELDEKIEYVHQNPVVRGLVRSPRDWEWSSARWYAGDFRGPVPIDRTEREYRDWTGRCGEVAGRSAR